MNYESIFLGQADEAKIIQECKNFTLDWIKNRHGSAVEFISVFEKEFGWQCHLFVFETLRLLRADKSLSNFTHSYLINTLHDEEVSAILFDGGKPETRETSTIDQLFVRSREYRASSKFAEAIVFISRFKEYSPFNNMLVYFQYPGATYFATEKHWAKVFRRTVKEDARAMVILAPKTPVLLVYDIDDTEGQPLPEHIADFSKVEGSFNHNVLDVTLKNCERLLIEVTRPKLSTLRAGYATTRLRNKKMKMKIAIDAGRSAAEAYSILCHEIAHILLGHLGPDKDNWWPERRNLRHKTVEIEAEAVAHIVCSRLGLRTNSAAYIAAYIKGEDDLTQVSIDSIARVASKIEEMGKRLLPAKKLKGEKG